MQDRTVFVDTTGISTTDFNLGKSKRGQLFNNGQDAATKFLSTWSWGRWQKDYEDL